MPTPFDNLVNLKPVDTGTTFIVNDLTGLTPAMIDSLKRTDSLETVEELWIRIKNNAYERLKLDFEVDLAEKRDFHHEMSETYPPKLDAQLAFASFPYFNGAIVEMCYNKHTAVEFNELIIWAETSGTGIIALYDKIQLKEISRTANVAITAGLNRILLTMIPTQKVDVFGMELFVGLKTNVQLRPMNANMWMGGAVCNVASVYSCQVDLDKVVSTVDFVKYSTTFPVHLSAKVIGDIDDMMTVHKIKLASAFRYLCGHLLLTERLSSENFNTFTNTLYEQMDELAKSYHVQYKSQLIKGIKTIYTNTDDTEVLDQSTEHQGGWFNASFI